MSLIPSFHDAERRRLANVLVDSIKFRKKAFEDNQIQPNILTTITAPNGWGKTRLIQEVYKRLASDAEFNQLELKRQSQAEKNQVRFSGYWPPSFASDHYIASLSLEDSRKLISPVDFDKNKNALPAFMWIGIQCHRKQTVKDMLASLEKHKEYLNDAAYFTTSNKENFLASLRELSREGVKDNIMGKLSNLALSAGDVSLGGVVAGIVKKAHGIYKDDKERKNRLDKQGPVEDKQKTDLLDTLRPIVEAGVPLVICLEDFHEADTALVSALIECLELDGPVVLLATQTLQNQRLASFNIGGIDFRQYSHLCEDESGRLEPLTPSSMMAIVKQYFPNTPDDQALAIVSKYNTPLMCQLLMELPVIKREAIDNTVTFALIDKLDIPPKIESIYENYFSELNVGTQKLLVMLAAMTNNRGNQWSKGFEKILCAALDFVEGESNYEDIRLNWCVRTQGDIYEFYSSIHEKLCLNRKQYFFGDKVINEITRVLIKKIASEPIDALDEKTVQLIDGILREILTCSPTLNDDLICACAAILQFGLMRNRDFDDCRQAIYEELEVWPDDLLGYEYSIGSYEDEFTNSYESFLDYLKNTVAVRDIGFVMQVIAKVGITLPPYNFSLVNKTDEDIFQTATKSEKDFLLDDWEWDNPINVPHEFQLSPRQKKRENIETWLAQSVINDVSENTSNSPVIRLLNDACWHLYPDLPKSIQNLDLAQSLLEEISERASHVKEIELRAQKFARQEVKAEAEKAIAKLDKEFLSLADSVGVFAKLNLASKKRIWSQALNKIEKRNLMGL
jgi:hypothetical protein